MEDYIYFIGLALWLGFSFYQQSQKKKRKEAEIRAARERQEQERANAGEYNSRPLPGEQPQTSFKGILEELLQEEEEFEKYEPITVEGADNFDDKAIQERNVYQRYLENNPTSENASLETPIFSRPSIEDMISAAENDKILLEEEMELSESQRMRRFDLRSAVIYSELLKSKY